MLSFFHNRIYTDKFQLPVESWKTLNSWVPNAKAYKLPDNWQGVDPYRSLVDMLEEDESQQLVDIRIKRYSQEVQLFAEKIESGLKQVDEQISCLKDRYNRYGAFEKHMC